MVHERGGRAYSTATSTRWKQKTQRFFSSEAFDCNGVGVWVGGPAVVPFLCHRGFKASWLWKQRGKNKLKAANTERGIGIIIKQLLASIQPGQWMSLGKLCDNPMAYIDHRAIPIQPRVVPQGVKQGGLRSICKLRSEGEGRGLRLSRDRFFLISSVVGTRSKSWFRSSFSLVSFRPEVFIEPKMLSLELMGIKKGKQKVENHKGKVRISMLKCGKRYR